MTKTVFFRQDVSTLTPESFSRYQIPEFRNGIIVRMPNHLGDAIMALPALSSLKTILPAHCGLFVITPKKLAPLYRALEIVDAIVPLKRPHRFFTASERREIRQLRPGAAVLFNHSFRDVLSLKLAGIKYLYGESSRCRGFLLDGKIPFRRHPGSGRSGSHQATRYLSLALALGGRMPDPFIPELHPPVPPDELPGEIKDLFRHPLLLAIAPGAASRNSKCWPGEYFAAVAGYWIRRGGIVVLTGSENDHEVCARIMETLPGNKCFNLCGRTGLHELMQIFRFSAFTLANDSGAMHLAAALRAPGMSVFGPTDWADTSPLSPDWLLLCRNEKCSPCRRKKCPRQDVACMKKITPLQFIRILKNRTEELNLPLGKYFHRGK